MWRKRLTPQVPSATIDYNVRPEECDRIIDLDLRGVFLCMKHEIPLMLEQGAAQSSTSLRVLGLEVSKGTRPSDASREQDGRRKQAGDYSGVTFDPSHGVGGARPLRELEEGSPRLLSLTASMA